ncbi:MAG: bacteriochlorophyll 4-vinyl reductase [Roseovarius sp.]
MDKSALTGAHGLVGPNAILQCREALEARGGPELARRIFAEAGLRAALDTPPDEMVPAEEARVLHMAIRAGLPPEAARVVTREAGRLTGEYILAHRIPARAQKALRLMPASLAGPILLAAIRRHSWTFAGEAEVQTRRGNPMVMEILRNPLAQPGCPWHIAVLETLYRNLVAASVWVEHGPCCAEGAPACRFKIHLRPR